MNWDKYFIIIAQNVLLKSKDRSTKVGAVIVDKDNQILSTGFNGFPRGINDNNENYHTRPLKYRITEHAERNAIYQAARNRGGLNGATLYLGHNPHYGICSNCARAIIQSGIKRVVGPEALKFEGKGDWYHDVLTAHHMLKEAGIKVESVFGDPPKKFKFDFGQNKAMTFQRKPPDSHSQP